jgi:ankyrin repeat protein
MNRIDQEILSDVGKSYTSMLNSLRAWENDDGIQNAYHQFHYRRYAGKICCDIVNILIRHGANLDIQNYQAPLRRAADNEIFAIVKFLIRHGVHLDRHNIFYPHHPVWDAHNNYLDILNRLIKQTANVDIHDVHGQSVLHRAVDNQCLAIIDSLIKHGVNVDIQDDNGRSPLHRAVYNRYHAIIDSLIKHGANIDIQDKNGQSPLQWAITHGFGSIVCTLIENNASVNNIDSEKLMYHSFAQGSLNAISRLLDQGLTAPGLEKNIGSPFGEKVTIRDFLQEKNPTILIGHLRNKDILSKLKSVKNSYGLFNDVIYRKYKIAKKIKICADRMKAIELKSAPREDINGVPNDVVREISYYLTECDNNNLIEAFLNPAKISEDCNALCPFEDRSSNILPCIPEFTGGTARRSPLSTDMLLFR